MSEQEEMERLRNEKETMGDEGDALGSAERRAIREQLASIVAERRRLKEALFSAQDALGDAKRDYMQERITYDDLRRAGIRVLEIRIGIEKMMYGRARTKVDALSVANIIR